MFLSNLLLNIAINSYRKGMLMELKYIGLISKFLKAN